MRVMDMHGRMAGDGGQRFLQACPHPFFVGCKVGFLQRTRIDARQARHGEVDADQVPGMRVPQLRRDDGAPVAAGRGEFFVVEAGHELHPQLSHARRAHAGAAQRLGETIARQGGHDDIEGIRGIAAMRRRIRQRPDRVLPVPERPRPAVSEDERHRFHAGRPLALCMDEVDGHAVDDGPELREAVDGGLLGAPIVVVGPVLDHGLKPAALDPVGPLVVAEIVSPARAAQATTYVLEQDLGDVDLEWRDVHVRMLLHPVPCIEISNHFSPDSRRYLRAEKRSVARCLVKIPLSRGFFGRSVAPWGPR